MSQLHITGAYITSNTLSLVGVRSCRIEEYGYRRILHQCVASVNTQIFRGEVPDRTCYTCTNHDPYTMRQQPSHIGDVADMVQSIPREFRLLYMQISTMYLCQKNIGIF